MNTVLKTTDLSKQYSLGAVKVNALQGIDFQVLEGEFVAIMGPSGSGKSTLLHLIGGLDVPSAGEVILAGRPISQMRDDEISIVRRREVGFVFQFYNLLPTLTALENIALPLLIDGKPLNRHQDSIVRLLKMVGLEDRQVHRPDQLSGGEQQRVAIARAFANQPKIVLADEPTGNLDSRAGETVLNMLLLACKELNVTVIMVTHDPRAAAYADRVVFLKDGQLVSEMAKPKTAITVDTIISQITELGL